MRQGLPAGFAGVDNAQFTINLSQAAPSGSNGLSRMLSVDTTSALANPITSINGVFAAAPTLYYTQITPSLLSPIPTSALYEYNEVM